MRSRLQDPTFGLPHPTDRKGSEEDRQGHCYPLGANNDYSWDSAETEERNHEYKRTLSMKCCLDGYVWPTAHDPSPPVARATADIMFQILRTSPVKTTEMQPQVRTVMRTSMRRSCKCNVGCQAKGLTLWSCLCTWSTLSTAQQS